MREPVDWPTRDLLAHRVRATPDRTALVDAGGGESWTYRDLDAAVEGAVAGLAALGVGPGDRVGSLTGARPAFVRLLHASMRLGSVLVPLDAGLPPDELGSRIGTAGLDALVAGADAEAGAVDAFDGPTATVDEPRLGGVRPLDADADGSGQPGPRRISRDRVQLLVFTSGTTGDPAAVRLTAGNLVASATASAFRLGVRPDDRWLSPLPAHHVGGIAPAVRSALYGTAVVVGRGFDAEGTARAIDEHGATGVSLVPTMLARMLDDGWSPPDRLRFVLLGGAPASPDLVDRCGKRGVPVHPTYGMTETASQVATARPEEAFEHPGTVGRPLVFTEVSVVDGDGGRCDPGEAGELVVDGPTVTPGYDDAAATDRAFGERGLHTGDVGYRDHEGRLWVVGRRDDAIQTGGEVVHPGEVIDALESHPAVEEAAVVGVADPEWGERVVALVVADGADEDDLLAHCRGRLAGYARPKAIRFAASIPRTGSGTVDRGAVRDRFR